jgi:tRNA threonylcarbamoyladenosine biosynthesis protein TsaB
MLLAVETATRQGSVALYGAEGLTFQAELGPDPNRTLAETVAQAVADRWSEIEAYGISVGPGSFTGLRIGLSFVKGLAIAQKKKLVPVSTLEVLAAELIEVHPGAAYYLPLLDAKKQEVYAALYRPDRTIDPILPRGLYAAIEVVARAADKAVVYGGDGALVVSPPAGWVVASGAPRAARLAELAWARLQAGEGQPGATVDLLYDQPAAAERNLGLPAPPFDSSATGS